MVKFTINDINGNIRAFILLTFNAVFVRSSFASLNLFSSCFSLLKALITLTPIKFSLITRLILSIFFCILVKIGIVLVIRSIVPIIKIGIDTNNISESFMFKENAMTMLPIPITGALITILIIMIVTC